MKPKATRYGYGEGLVHLGEEDNNVVALSADVTGSTATNFFADKFPDRFFNIGIAEQNLLGVAAGLALMGKIPYACAYSMFVTGRAWDQIRNTICYSDLNVKITGTHSGLTVGPDGATHQALEDIAIMRGLPNMKVIVPCDYYEAKKATRAIKDINGPVYLRLGRTPIPIITDEHSPFEYGKVQVIKEGRDVAVFACGITVSIALEAAKILESENISVKVVNVHTIKPLDEEGIVNIAKQVNAVVTAEEHQITGGLGSAIAEVLGKNYPIPIEMLGVEDKFGESGNPNDLLKLYGLTAENLITYIKKAISRK